MTRDVARTTHILFALLYISGIFWLAWWYMLLVFAVLRVQDRLLGGCVLTKWEYGSFDRRWMEFKWVERTGMRLPTWTLLMDWVSPSILVVLAFVIQSA